MNKGIRVDQATAIQDGRARHRMSQEHLASAAGISARTVVRAESGFRVSGESMRNICAVLGLDAGSIAPIEAASGGIDSEEAPAEPVEATEIASGPAPEAQDVGESLVQENSGPPAGYAPLSRLQRAFVFGRTPVKRLPRERLPTLYRANVSAILFPLMFLAFVLGFSPMVNRVTVLSDTGRWIVEAPASQTAATYLNALAAGRQTTRPPALSYFACEQAEDTGFFLRLVEVLNGNCGFSRHEILVETVRPSDGSVQTIVGPVGREFGRDLARRLSGDPKVSWKVAFATGRQARGLAWFDPREVPIQDMPRPPDAPSTWVYVAMKYLEQ